MNTASLELCKELYELSGWEATYFVHWFKQDLLAFDADEWIVSPRQQVHQTSISAYDLGYLLRKLPDLAKNIQFHTYHKNWISRYENTDEDGYQTLLAKAADTPEDAVCKLAIELFKQGILKKQPEGGTQ